jgi:hypothetical protein
MFIKFPLEYTANAVALQYKLYEEKRERKYDKKKLEANLRHGDEKSQFHYFLIYKISDTQLFLSIVTNTLDAQKNTEDNIPVLIIKLLIFYKAEASRVVSGGGGDLNTFKKKIN